MSTINVPINLGVSGEFAVEVFDVVTQKVRSKQVKKNMLMTGFLNSLFTDATMRLYGSNASYIATWPNNGNVDSMSPFANATMTCLVGSGTTAPTRANTNLQTQLASVTPNNYSSTTSALTDEPIWFTRYFVFPAGTFTGTVAEVGVKHNTILVARQLLDTPLVITVNDELRITWKFNIYFGTQIYTGTIAAGQRDGVTNINWVTTINNNQKLSFISQRAAAWMWSASQAIPCRLGTSNAASNLTTDTNSAIKGTAVFTASPPIALKTVAAYTSGNFYRDVTIGFEHNSPNNVSIGEMVVSGGEASFGVPTYSWRTTFTPALDKATEFRVFVKFRVSITPINGS